MRNKVLTMILVLICILAFVGCAVQAPGVTTSATQETVLVPTSPTKEKTTPTTEATTPVATEPIATDPVETFPDETVPEHTVPEVTVHEDTTPEPTIPEATTPEATEPTTTAPEESVGELRSLGVFRLTAYCPCQKCCGKYALDRPVDEYGNVIVYGSIGVRLEAGVSIAVDPKVIPYRSQVVINGHTYTAHDTGGAIKGNRIDVYFEDHQEALKFGVQYVEVFVFVTDEIED